MSRGSWARAAGAAVASCLLIVTPLAAAPASATPTPTAPPTPGSAGASSGASSGVSAGAADLVVASVTPLELRPGQPVTVAGQVEGGSAGLVGARIEVRRAASRSTSVSSLERWTAPVNGSGDGPQEGPGSSRASDDTAGDDEEDDGREDPADSARTELEVDLGDIGPDGTVPFSVVLDGAELGLRDRGSDAGPYGLQLVLLSRDRVVDDERGFLVWSPPVEVAPTLLSSSLTLLGPPADGTTGLPDADLLVEEISPGGRLDRLLDAAVVLGADWLLDPTLLAGVAALAGHGPGQDGDPAEPTGDGSGDGTATDGPTAEQTDGTGRTPGAVSPDAAPGGPSGESTAGVEPSAPDEQPEPTDASDPLVDPSPDPSAEPSAEPAEGGGTPAPAPTSAQVEAAARWLDALTAGRGGREVVLTGWADPDPVRIRSADDPDDALAVLRKAQEEALPPALVEELLDGRARDDVLVATDGPVTARDLATLADGRSSLLLPEHAVPLEDPFALSYTPDEVTTVRLPPVGGDGAGSSTDPEDGPTDPDAPAVGDRSGGATSVTAVLVDPGLSADAVQALRGSPLAGTRLVARLATTTLQRPNDSRLLSMTLPAQLVPVPGAADRLSRTLDDSQWVQQVSLSTALGTPPSDAPRARLAAGPPTPPVPGVQALLDAVSDGRRVAAALGRPVDEEATVLLDLRAAATLSRRADLGAPALLAEQLRAETAAAVGGVRVVPGSRITLAAAQAGLPVTVVNDLDTEARLVLRVRSRSPRLQVAQADLPVTVPPGQRAVVDVPVTAVASGRADVTSQLVTEDGRAWGEPATVTVTVATQVEGRVLGVVGAVVGVLFVLGAVRAFVRNRRGRELADQGQVQP